MPSRMRELTRRSHRPTVPWRRLPVNLTLIARNLIPHQPSIRLKPFDPSQHSRLIVRDNDHAITRALAGGGSLAVTFVANDDKAARNFIAGAARAHGRIQIVNRESATESTGHGSPLPQLVHAGPGQAGGGEELDGLRGAKVQEDVVLPFREYFEELQPGNSLLTHRRTLTEADIVNFACLNGDHFYAHMDKMGAEASFFGERVVHGYFIVAAAAGLFVDAGVGPVIANYGLEGLRFLQPVKPGDTIQARFTCQKKPSNTSVAPKNVPRGSYSGRLIL